MFMAQRNLSAVDFAVMRGIEELHERDEYISTAMIAQHVWCERNTAARAVRRLIAAGIIQRGEGSPQHGGYRYVVSRIN